MSEIITVGLNLAKNVLQVHGADSKGYAALRRHCHLWTAHDLQEYSL